MKSFRMVYDAEGDIFDVDFRLAAEETAAQGCEVSDNVTIWTDAKLTRVHRLMFISYSKLLERQTVKLSFLKKLPAIQRNKIQRALEQDPVKRFLICRDKEKYLYSLVGPDVGSMVKAA
jgi:hypothetical protein